MTDESWRESFARSLAVFLNGSEIPSLDARGERIIDESFLLLFNAHHEAMDFRVPTVREGAAWRQILSTSHAVPDKRSPRIIGAGETVRVEAIELVVLQEHHERPDAEPRNGGS